MMTVNEIGRRTSFCHRPKTTLTAMWTWTRRFDCLAFANRKRSILYENTVTWEFVIHFFLHRCTSWISVTNRCAHHVDDDVFAFNVNRRFRSAITSVVRCSSRFFYAFMLHNNNNCTSNFCLHISFALCSSLLFRQDLVGTRGGRRRGEKFLQIASH